MTTTAECLCGAIRSPGTLDAAFQSRLVRHIYVRSKAAWWAIHDDLPQFDELPD